MFLIHCCTPNTQNSSWLIDAQQILIEFMNDKTKEQRNKLTMLKCLAYLVRLSWYTQEKFQKITRVLIEVVVFFSGRV